MVLAALMVHRPDSNQFKSEVVFFLLYAGSSIASHAVRYRRKTPCNQLSAESYTTRMGRAGAIETGR